MSTKICGNCGLFGDGQTSLEYEFSCHECRCEPRTERFDPDKFVWREER